MSSFEDLRTHEVLWLINRVVFHPRGFALALEYPDKAAREDILAHRVEPSGWSLVGDGSETWRYAEDTDEDSAFRTVEAFFARHRRSPE